MSKQDWYSAKTIYKHHRVEAGKTKTVFEERVVLLRATGFDDAIAKAEAEAAVYCGTDGDAIYLGFVDVFHLFDEKVGHGTEVYSLMRESGLANKKYLDHFYDDGKERRQIYGELA
jgi:hypothetical protein